MCGIVGYTGKKSALPFLLDGLEQLEYRGYDSAGVAVVGEGGAAVVRSVGATKELRERIGDRELRGTSGLGHTRWATHGVPSEKNAHPHAAGPLLIVHNGIVENSRSLREELEARGEVFASDTDTETIVRLVNRTMEEGGLSLADAVRSVIHRLEGSYSFLILHQDPEVPLVAVHRGAPLVVGLCDHGVFVASDVTAFPSEVRSTVFLEPDDLLTVEPSGLFGIRCLASGRERAAERIGRNRTEEHGKGDYPHYMLKEICEQPRVLAELLAGKISSGPGGLSLHLPPKVEAVLARARRLRIVGCGTSYHAGLLGKYRIEDLAGRPVEVEIASEFRYREPLLDPKSDLLVALTQSGEPADTLAALRMAREAGVPTLALVNVPGSTIAREADAVLFLEAGPEFGVAATKTFLAQIALLTLLALHLAPEERLVKKTGLSRQALLTEFLGIPGLLDKSLSLDSSIASLARELAAAPLVLFLGRGADYPLALEGALKFKEITYIHAEGYPGGELKHGPLALVEKDTPVIALISPEPRLLPKMVSNLQETLARGARQSAITARSAFEEMAPLVATELSLPDCSPLFFPILSSVPLQLLAYHTACARGLNVDRPRNLAKSVTVE